MIIESMLVEASVVPVRPLRLHPSALDVQVAYDTLVRRCVSEFNAGEFISPLFVAVVLGAADGEIEILESVQINDLAKLMALGHGGSVMGEFFQQALTNEVFRKSLIDAGHRPPDMLMFLAEVIVHHVAENDNNSRDQDALMVLVHTAESSFRSMLSIEMPHRQVFYTPLQMDSTPAGKKTIWSAALSLENMVSSVPFLVATHSLHDLHIQCNAALH